MSPPSDDSSDEDDAFSKFSRKKKSISSSCSKKVERNEGIKGVLKTPDPVIVPPPETATKAETSSNKRHHFQSSARAAKMEALLLELQETSANPTPLSERPPPDKMGSFVMPGEEQFTTNIFVGNLAPITTEEELTEVFRQFGET